MRGVGCACQAQPCRLELGIKFPLSSADDLGTSSRVSGVFGHGWHSTFHCTPPSPQIFHTYLKQECLYFPVILFSSSQTKLSLLAICFIFGFLSRNETEGNRNSAPSRATPPREEAHWLLFALKQQLLKSVTVTNWLGVIHVPNHIYLQRPSAMLFCSSTKTAAPAPCLCRQSLRWCQAARTIQVSCWPHVCVSYCGRGSPGIPSHCCWQTNSAL